MNFISIAKSKNKIKSLSDITLIEYSELYINNYLFEQNTKYNYYEVGDIVFVYTYKYQSGKMGNNHMFLIIDSKKNKDKIVYYGMLISSKIEKVSFKANKILHKDNKNNLKKDSIIKTDVIYKIFTKNILLKIGNIDKTKVDIYKNYLIYNN